MSTPPGYIDLLQCPYEKAHRIQAHAMTKHLFKCRKNHPNQKLVSCPFNETHHVPQAELKIHAQHCEDRASFDTYKYCISSKPAHAMATPAPVVVVNNSPPKDAFSRYRSPSNDVEDDEDGAKDDAISPPPPVTNDDDCWDDMNVPAYNPQRYCAKANVIRKATLKTPSEKKAFYEAERLRHRQLKELEELKLAD